MDSGQAVAVHRIRHHEYAIFLREDKYGDYTVLDGRQRLTAIYEFLRNTYLLKNLDVWSELNGLRYSVSRRSS